MSHLTGYIDGDYHEMLQLFKGYKGVQPTLKKTVLSPLIETSVLNIKKHFDGDDDDDDDTIYIQIIIS